MNTERLLRIAEIVEAVPVEEFDMDAWEQCGTVRCAAGWAASTPDIIAQGFILKMAQGGDRAVYFEGLWDYDAIEAFLEVGNSSLVYRLFSPSAYLHQPLPSYVARCIRHTVAGGEIPDSGKYWTDVVTAN